MSVRKKARLEALDDCLRIAEHTRLDRPEKPRGSSRRRCGDVIRWKANNAAVDQVKADIKALMKADILTAKT